MEYSTHVFLQQTPITEPNFESKLQDISDQITTNGCISPHVFSPFTNLAVQQAVVSSKHLAFLLQDGRICRLAFRIQTEKIEPNPTEPSQTKSKHLSRSHSRQSLHRPNFENLVLSSHSSLPSTIANTNPTGQIDFLSGYSLNRHRHVIRTARGRQGIILGSRPVTPASSVPEELIEQVQVVLQGKSRTIVLRELQRTNLDVNLAVNNLLARDNEGDEDLDDEYVGTDLISLLDVNPHNDHPGIILESEFFDEADFALRYSSIQRRVASVRMANNAATAAAAAAAASGDPTLERDRKRHRYDPRWLDGSLREELFGRIDRESKPDDLSLVKDSNPSIRKGPMIPYQHQLSAPAALATSSATSSPILFSEQLQFWTDTDNNTPLQFTHMACLHSELIAINLHGQLCQWNWHDDYPFQDLDNPQIRHPKTSSLKLFHEKIINLSANLIRASILTETNRLATWIDESLGTQVNLKLQHFLQEFSAAHILDIQTSPLCTIFRTETNDLYWYGLLPHKPRKKLLERLKDKSRQKQRSNSQQQTITIGCSVCLISNPYYNQGAWGFSIRDGQPKLGQLMEQAWLLSNTARFRIKTWEFLANKTKDDDKSSVEMPPPPSPASSTCSVDSNPSFPSTLKRKKPSTNAFLSTINDSDSNEQHSKIKDEEYWPLDEVIFIDDCKVAPVGKVMKIDGSLVLVKFPSKNNDTNDDSYNLDNCRILRKDDLQVVKGNQTPKTPDCTLPLANAKRISLENGTLLTYSVDKDYLHTLQLRDSTVFYLMYEIGSNNGFCRMIRQNQLPLINNRQSLSSFLTNNPGSLRLTSLNSPRVVLDGNQLIYPLITNHDHSNFKDPQWKNLFGINYFSHGIIPIKSTDNTTRTHLILNIMQMKKGILIPHILRYDFEKIRSILNELELHSHDDDDDDDDLLKLIFDEQMDGGRNLFHACIHIAIPLTNKEYPMNEEQPSNDKRISFAMDLLQSQTNNDHNYGDTTTTTEQPINTWPPSGDSSVPNDAQPSSTSFHRTLSNSAGIIPNPGSVSPSYTPSTLSSKIQYHRNQVMQQETNNNNSSSQTSQFGPVLSPARPNVNYFTVWPSCKYDERDKRQRAIKILRLLLDYPLFQDHLLSLLNFRNLEGQTPFMSAITSRAYHSAIILFEYALKISKHSDHLLLRMIYPLTSTHADDSPLFTLCTNDTCSFTWTGEEHISQAIFECKTCGLSGTLCCCSECAQTCHKGHDCRLKRTSPTAYCDCWEVCKCKSLIAGDQQKRLELLKLLLNQTNLVEMKNARRENLLLYLVQTVARQIVEQQQFARTSTAAILQQQARKTREQLANAVGAKKLPITTEMESNIPDHHLEPPQFCRRALELILADWSGVKSMLLCGCPDDFDPTMNGAKQSAFETTTSSPSMGVYNNENIFPFDEQHQTSQLDRFTYFLLAKCNTLKQTTDLLDILLNTLTREISNPNNSSLARYVTARFVRSVVRLFIIVHLQSSPEKSSGTMKSSTSTVAQSILSQCKRVFQTLTITSIHALVHSADLLLAPVRHGIARPTAMFNSLSTHTDILQSLDEVFNIDSDCSRTYQRGTTDVLETDLEENDNHSDNQSQPEIDPSNMQDRQPTTTSGREHLANSLSDDESEMELELLAESDSDNESNHSASNTNAHRTSTTAGNENIALFSDDENSDSDDADSVQSESVLGEGDETSQPEPTIFDDARDALAAAAGASSTTTTATTMDRLVSAPPTTINPTGTNTQTAASQLTGPRLPSRAAITASIFGDSQSRRQIPPVTPTSSSANHPTPAEPVQSQTNTISIHTSNSLLARAFAILIRQITDLLVRWSSSSSSSDSIPIHEQNTIDTIKNEIEQCLINSWQWFATVMDSLESQIRFGVTLSNLRHQENDTTLQGNRFLRNLIDRAKIESKKKATTNRTSNPPINDKPINNRLESLNYSLSLMRSSHEHGDQEPSLDILFYRHLAYLLDGFIYYFRENGGHEISSTNKSNTQSKEMKDEDSKETDPISSKDTFFQRSSSTLCLSSLGPDPFQIAIDDSLPLACRPQLLQPICRKEDLFGRFLYDQTATRYSQLPPQLGLSNRQRSIPDFLQPNYLNLFQQTKREDVAVNVLLDLSAGLITSNKSDQKQSTSSSSILLNGSYEYLLARWRFSIELFVKLFLDDVGNEPGSIIYESSGFSAREQRFRHDMERLKNIHQKDIRFEAMERDRIALIQKTFRTLNSYFYRNQSINASSSSIPPLAVQRVKVTFKDEPGEGSGVARSFYASIVEAILSEEKFPVLESSTYGVPSATQSASSQTHRQSRPSRDRRPPLPNYLRSERRSSPALLSSEARPFKFSSTESSIIEHWTPSRIKIGLSIYPQIAAIQPFYAEKITGMFLEGLQSAQLQRMINIDEELKAKIDEAMNILTSPTEIPSVVVNDRLLSNKQLNEDTPLFWQPDQKGVYAPRPGKHTPERLTAYRNVGRLIGLCLLQNELFPLPLCRHVIKYILHRSIRWHDLAFFDSTMYENLRRTAFEVEKNGTQYINDLHLTFSTTVTDKEGGETYDLIPDGSSKDITETNFYQFIKRYSEFRMIDLVEQSLQHLRLGVFDVLPSTALDYLTPEDFRLLLNGTSNINVTTLTAYTTFNDESGETPERINQFKKWFWSVLEKFNPIERQDLIYFWTGSPALPASEAGFQPQPSVTIRPADDQHLPTANTCISRLYVPLYSSKTILKLKLQYAIKTKMFGFV